MDLDALGKEIAAALPGAVRGHTVARGELTLDARSRRNRPRSQIFAGQSCLPV